MALNTKLIHLVDSKLNKKIASYTIYQYYKKLNKSSTYDFIFQIWQRVQNFLSVHKTRTKFDHLRMRRKWRGVKLVLCFKLMNVVRLSKPVIIFHILSNQQGPVSSLVTFFCSTKNKTDSPFLCKCPLS